MIQIFKQIFIRLKAWFIWLWKLDGTPSQRARGLAAGVFCGCFPLFGFQTILGIALARRIRGNPIIAVAGTLISNPITYLPLYWLNYQVGNFLLAKNKLGDYPKDLLDNALFAQGWQVISKLFIGSTIVGIFTAGVIGFSIYGILKLLARVNFPNDHCS